MDKVNSAILDILSTDKRATIPEVGSLIRRQDSNEIVFVDLLKKNDGKLLKMIQHKFSTSEEEATGILEGYIVRLNHDIHHYGEFRIDGIGRLRISSGMIVLDQTFSDAPKNDTPKENAATKQPEIERAVNNEPAKDNHNDQSHSATYKPTREPNNRIPEPAHKPAQKSYASQPQQPQPQQPSKVQPTNMAQAQRDRRVASEVVRQPSPEADIRVKPEAEKTRVRPEAEKAQIRPEADQRPRPAHHSRPNDFVPKNLKVNIKRRGKSKPDMITIIAIIAAAIAVGAIIYGSLVNSTPKLDLQQTEYQIQTDAETPTQEAEQ